MEERPIDGAEDEGEVPKVPISFWIMIALVGLYTAWRIVQLLGRLIAWLLR